MKKLHRSLLVSLVALVGCAPGGESNEERVGKAQEASTICPGKTTVQGVDISADQPNTNWTTLAASRGFAVVKATEGVTFTDADFHTNWAGMKTAGMVRGAYHFFHPDDDPVQQADFFVSTMGALGPGDLGGTLDLEVTDGESSATIVSRALAFLQRVEQKSGKTPMIYTSPGFWDGLSGDKSAFAHFTLWVANWETTCPTVPAPWTTLTFWQYADNGTVPGVSGGVDHDLFNGSLDALKAFAGQSTDPGLDQVNGNEGLSAINWSDDKHVELFVKSSNGNVNHAWSKAATDSWNAPAKLDGGGQCGFASVMWPAPYSYPEVLSAIAPKDSVSHLWWTSGKGWNTFQDLGGQSLGHLSTITWPDGHAEVFALGDDGSIWHDYWDVTKSDWSGWTSLDGANLVTGVGPIRWADGHVELFATDAQGLAWHNWSGATGWQGWAKLSGALASRPIPVRWADGHVEVFATGKDSLLYHSDWKANVWPTFSVVDSKTKIIGEPSVIMNAKGGGGAVGPEVFARGLDGEIVHLGWDGTKFTSFEKLGALPASGDPFGWTRLDGTAEVFVIGDDGKLMKNDRPTSGTWSGWSSIGDGPYDACAEAAPDAGSGGGGSGQGGASSHHEPSSADGSGVGGGDGDSAGPDGACSCRLGERTNGDAAWLVLGAALVPLLRRRRRVSDRR